MTLKKKIVLITLLILSAAVVFIIKHMDMETFEERDLKGDTLYSQGKYEQAVTTWSRLLKKKSAYPELYEKVGLAFLKLADWKNARKYFEKARLMLPQVHGIDLQLTRIDLELIRIDLLSGDLLGAEKRCLKLLKLNENMADDPEFNTVYGDLMVLSGNLKRAETYYRKAHLTDPTSARYALKMAICLVSQGRGEDAGTFFELAKAASDNSPELLVQMAEYFILLKEYDRAENYLNRALEMNPHDPELKIRGAKFYFFMGKLESAEILLADLLESQQDNIVFKKMLADIYLSLKRMPDAEKIISEIRAVVGDDDPEYNLIQGKYWLLSGNPVYAATHLKAAVDLIPGFVFARYYLSVAYLAAGQKQLAENSVTKTLMYDPEHTSSQLLMTDLLYKKKRFDLAEEYLDQVIAKEPESYRAYMLKGLNALSLEDYDLAVVQFVKAFALDSQAVAPLYYLGVSSELANRQADALLYYKQAMARQSGFADISYRYAMLLVNMGRADKAEAFVEELVTTHSDRPYLYYVAAEVFLKNSREQQAITYLQNAVSDMECPAYFYIKLAKIYQSRGDGVNSLRILEECLSIYPHSKNVWITMAQLYLDSGKLHDAMALLEKAEKKLPNDPEILSNLAWCYLETDSNLDMALEYARSAYEKMPENSAIADTLGWAYYKKKSFGQASWILTETEMREPDNGWVLYHLGMSLYREGKLPGALEKLKKAAQQQQTLSQSVLETINKYIERLVEKDLSKDPPLVDNDTMDMLDQNSALDFPETTREYEDDILEPQWQDQEGMLKESQRQW